MNSNLAIDARGLTKRYGDRAAISGLNLEVKFGECFGIFGPKGSGKSTALSMMYGSTLFDQGELFVLGLNVKSSITEIKSRIGVLTQSNQLEVDFTVKENLSFYGKYHSVDKEILIHRLEDILKQLEIEDLSDQFVHTLTSSLKRRVAVARSLVNKPEILFLDDIIFDLDQRSRSLTWSLISDLKNNNGTVLLASQSTKEVEKICDRVAILDHGKILACGNPKKLINDLIGFQVLELPVSINELPYYVSRLKTSMLKFQVGEEVIYVYLSESKDLKSAMDLCQGIQFSLRAASLSDVFYKLTGRLFLSGAE